MSAQIPTSSQILFISERNRENVGFFSGANEWISWQPHTTGLGNEEEAAARLKWRRKMHNSWTNSRYFVRSCACLQACLASKPEPCLQPPFIQCIRSTKARGDQEPPGHLKVYVHNVPCSGGAWMTEGGDKQGNHLHEPWIHSMIWDWRILEENCLPDLVYWGTLILMLLPFTDRLDFWGQW